MAATAPATSTEPSDLAERSAQLTNAGVVGVALSYIDNSGIARCKAIPVERLAHAATDGVGMSPVFDVFIFDDAITASPNSTGPVGDLRLFPDLKQLTVLAAQPGWAWAPVDRRTQAGAAHPGCQRSFARRMEQGAAERGITIEMGFEPEWVLDRGTRDTFLPATDGPAHGMDRLIDVSNYCSELLTAADRQLLARHAIRAVTQRWAPRAWPAIPA